MVNVTAVALALESPGLPRKQPSCRNSAALSPLGVGEEMLEGLELGGKRDRENYPIIDFQENRTK